MRPEVEQQIDLDWTLVHFIQEADADLNVAQADFLTRAICVLMRERPLASDLRRELQLISMTLDGLTAND